MIKLVTYKNIYSESYFQAIDFITGNNIITKYFSNAVQKSQDGKVVFNPDYVNNITLILEIHEWIRYTYLSLQLIKVYINGNGNVLILNLHQILKKLLF